MTSPKLANTTRTGRTYKHPLTGMEYPSVTTVLGTIGKGEALKHWAAGEVAKYAVKNRESWTRLDDAAAIDLLKREPLRFLDRAASRGTDVHALAETYAKTGTMPQWADEISGYVTALINFFQEHQPTPVLVEHTVFNADIGYAGSFDLVCKLAAFDNMTTILDYKTSKAVYPDVAAQLAAYANGTEYIDENGTPQPMPVIERGVVVRLAVDGTYEVVECDIAAGWNYFKAVRAVYSIPTKPLLLGTVRATTANSDTRDLLKEKLVARLAWMKENNRDALNHVVKNWMQDLPTFKSDHQHNTIELARIEKLVVDAEREFNVPFHEAVTQPVTPPAPQPTVVQDSKMVEILATDELTVDQSEVEKVRKRLERSTEATKESVRKIAQQANRAKRNISLSGKPSLRRVLIADFLIGAIEQSDGTTDLVETILEHCGARTAKTLGHDIGGLEIGTIETMTAVLTAIKNKTKSVIYNNNNNRFDIVDQKGK